MFQTTQGIIAHPENHGEHEPLDDCKGHVFLHDIIQAKMTFDIQTEIENRLIESSG